VSNLPPVVQIGPLPFDVSIVKDLTVKEDDGTVVKIRGRIIYHELQIKIDKNMPEEVKVAVLWHELIHGLLYQAEYAEHTEEMVLALGYAIYGAIRANPELVELTLKV
jgi:hypothetical protein